MQFKAPLVLAIAILLQLTAASSIKKITYENTFIEIDETAGKYRALNEKRGQGFWVSQDLRLHMKMARLDPLETSNYNLIDTYERQLSKAHPLNRDFFRELREEDQQDVFLVQFYTQAFQEFQQALKEKFGAKILFPFPSQSLLIQLSDPTLIGPISELPFVRWVGPYLPLYKLSTDIFDLLLTNPALDSKLALNLMLTERGPQAQSQVRRAIRQFGGEVLSTVPEGFRMEVSLSLKQFFQILRHSSVLYADLITEKSVDMNIARLTGGLHYVSEVGGYRGERIRAEVMDSGLYTGHTDFRGLNIMFHGGNSASTNHGTSVFGIVFGQGIINPQALGGLAQAEASIFAPYDILNVGYTRYQHTQELVNATGIYRAVFQTNSWGNTQTTRYTAISAEMDDIIFLYDFTILQSQSNMGNQNSRPQAWAKNVNSIGGIRHYNTLTRTDDRWGAGASIGPAEDGRLKPDICHYYDLVISPNDIGDTYREFSGTSAATPITAGHYGILFQMWADGVFNGGPGQNRDPFTSRPHSSTVKAIMINTANAYPFDADSTDLLRNHQGWGLPDVGAAYDLATINGWKFPVLVDESDPITPQEIISYTVRINPGDVQTFLKATLTYRDPMPPTSASKQLINNLDLQLISPSGILYWGNVGLDVGACSAPGGEPSNVDNVENIFICNAEAGVWTISVWGTEIIQDANPDDENGILDAVYALVVTKGRNYVI